MKTTVEISDGVLSEVKRYAAARGLTLKEVIETAGGMTHDARIVAICRQHGVKSLWSADRDLTRFAGVKVINPLVGKSR